MKLYTELDGHGALRSTNIAHDIPHDIAAAHALMQAINAAYGPNGLSRSSLFNIGFNAAIDGIRDHADDLMRQWGFEVE